MDHRKINKQTQYINFSSTPFMLWRCFYCPKYIFPMYFAAFHYHSKSLFFQLIHSASKMSDSRAFYSYAKNHEVNEIRLWKENGRT